MNPSPQREQNLEQAIHRALRDLPPRPAPHSLEQRVLAEIARRAALPWWRKSFVHWPVAARAAFVGLCIGVAAALVVSGVWIMAGAAPLREALVLHFAWIENLVAVAKAIGGVFEIMMRNIPALWLYGALAFVASMYVALFGLGAAAYRTLYAQR